MKERAGDEHRLDTNDETEHPANIRPRRCAKKENGGARCEQDCSCDVQPTAHEGAYQLWRGVERRSVRHALTIRCCERRVETTEPTCSVTEAGGRSMFGPPSQ